MTPARKLAGARYVCGTENTEQDNTFNKDNMFKLPRTGEDMTKEMIITRDTEEGGKIDIIENTGKEKEGKEIEEFKLS